MTTYTITHDETDYGAYSAAGAGEALLRCLQSNEPGEYDVRFLSDSPSYGRGAPGRINGNGAGNTQDWFYVHGDDGSVSIFTAHRAALD